MNNGKFVTIDGNEAVAHIAHRTNEVIAIYPITPSSPMGEFADEWSSKKRPNIWGTVPLVAEMQSEGGASGAVHGALQAGALTTTFTSSQGLLLMIPNMFKIAGELTSTVFQIAARTIATHALSIFGDHSDVMAARSTGWAMLFGNSVQEAHDMALIAQASTLSARVPFLNVFDGFRTSHEIQKIKVIPDEVIREMLPDDLIAALRKRALNPETPFIRGTSQNPDVFFQSRETSNPFYSATPAIVQKAMDKFAGLTGRKYSLFEYFGPSDAERVIIMMGSGAETVEATLPALQKEKVGLLKVRLYRPFANEAFLKALPASCKSIAVLDRTKEPGATGEPLYNDVMTAICEASINGTLPLPSVPRIIGVRYGLSSKEFTPAMIKGIYDELKKSNPKNHATIGINDDITNTSIDYDPLFDIEDDKVVRAVFWGLGSDGTVGANKNSIKIIGEETDNFAQGYFVYDSKKAGAITISHLRFGPKPIKNIYLIRKANFIAVHQYQFLYKYDVFEMAQQGATVLINMPYAQEEVWSQLPLELQKVIIDKKLKVYSIDAYKVAKETGMGVRINTIMQTCFFAISGVLPKDEAIAKIKDAIKKTYGKRGEQVIQQNFAAVDAALSHLNEIKVPVKAESNIQMIPPVPDDSPEFVKNVIGPIIAGKGDSLPVSAFPKDGTYPSATTQWERRNITLEVPVFDKSICIQCGKCVFVCPHACLRAKIFTPDKLNDAPKTFEHTPAKWPGLTGYEYSIQVSPEDCTGCTLCVKACPVKNKENAERKAINMEEYLPIKAREIEKWNFLRNLPEVKQGETVIKFNTVKDIQLLQPLFEFSGACAGCGETPYIKLMTQLFGDRALIANATGCSSIYGGNLPTTPYAKTPEGRGPAWNNSLFEDNAEFGFGMRLAVDIQTSRARQLVEKMRNVIGSELADSILNASQNKQIEIDAQRKRVAELKKKLEGRKDMDSRDLLALSDMLVKRSIWIVGGDGWAYDIGYGGLDHVLASGKNVNVLVLDTEVYSNTGGQASKSTPLGAVAKFAAGGKSSMKKDLGLLAMAYKNVYVAQVAFGAKDQQTVQAFMEAEAYDGPSIIIAYSPCIAHGIDMAKGLDQQKAAVNSGQLPLYRFNPDNAKAGKPVLTLDYSEPKTEVSTFLNNETRFTSLARSAPEVAKQFAERSQEISRERWEFLSGMVKLMSPKPIGEKEEKKKE
ncbi:MAG: pyruvate:ferredoxin (flavodoxin) oxidoreductase [Candidatus Hydrogenedentes bacterium CG1_02_42_14]|nr:MAG: pyruvate:ferredoxin (flavodoxin) oxidoreductase [Candidatus Hydrogenedentes bacterium CG1_02_42_14]